MISFFCRVKCQPLQCGHLYTASWSTPPCFSKDNIADARATASSGWRVLFEQISLVFFRGGAVINGVVFHKVGMVFAITEMALVE